MKKHDVVFVSYFSWVLKVASPLLVVVGLVVACGTPEEPKGLQWKDMTRSEKLVFMGTKVYPTIKALFEEHDPARFGGNGADGKPKFQCSNCHGADYEKRNFVMPNPFILPLDPNKLPTGDSKDPHLRNYGVFMSQKVLPTMKKLLEDVGHPKAKELYCFNCHTKTNTPPKENPPVDGPLEEKAPVDGGNVDKGTPETPPTEVPPAVTSFKKDIAPLFTKYGCTPGCHGGSGGLDLGADAYKNLVGVASTMKGDLKRVTAGASDKSMLYLKVEAKVLGKQPPAGSPMPLNAQTFSKEDLATLKTWIDEGAKDN